MTRFRPSSPQSVCLLRALAAQPMQWRYGYDLMKETGLQSGTLYPLLMRLSDQGFLESEWHTATRAGRPPRHSYRLTPAGLTAALALEAINGESAAPDGLPAT